MLSAVAGKPVNDRVNYISSIFKESFAVRMHSHSRSLHKPVLSNAPATRAARACIHASTRRTCKSASVQTRIARVGVATLLVLVPLEYCALPCSPR